MATLKTADEFEAAVGVPPKDDDLDRANCKLAGRYGHLGCGWCDHGKPVFMCHECFTARVQPSASLSKRNEV